MEDESGVVSDERSLRWIRDCPRSESGLPLGMDLDPSAELMGEGAKAGETRKGPLCSVVSMACPLCSVVTANDLDRESAACVIFGLSMSVLYNDWVGKSN